MVDNPNITWLQLPNGVMLHLIKSKVVKRRAYITASRHSATAFSVISATWM